MESTHFLRHFAKHLFLVSRVHAERNMAKADVGSHLQKMRKSIIRMNLGYSDIDRLKEKVSRLVESERKYSKFFKPEDDEAKELKNQINILEQELNNEREEKQRIISDNDEKIRQLTESLNSIKKKMNELLMEKSKRQQRLTALDRKIREKVDVHKFYTHG